jgi:hypothetical protein
MQALCAKSLALLLALFMGVGMPAHLAIEHAAHGNHPAGCRDAAHACHDHDHDAPGIHAVCDNHDHRGCGQAHCHARDLQEHLKAATARDLPLPAPATLAQADPAEPADTAQAVNPPHPGLSPGSPPHHAGTPHRGPPHA